MHHTRIEDAARLPYAKDPYGPIKPRDANFPKPPGAILPALPPHATSPRANTNLSSFALAPADDPAGGWQTCLGGGNQLPLPVRLGAAGAEPRLGNYGVCKAAHHRAVAPRIGGPASARGRAERVRRRRAGRRRRGGRASSGRRARPRHVLARAHFDKVAVRASPPPRRASGSPRRYLTSSARPR